MTNGKGHRGHTSKKQGHSKMSSSGSNSSSSSYGQQASRPTGTNPTAGPQAASPYYQPGNPATSNAWGYQGPLQDSTSQQSTAGSYGGASVDEEQRRKQEYDQWVRAQYARDHPGVSYTGPLRRNSHSRQFNDFDNLFGGQGSQSTPAYYPQMDMRDLEEPRSHSQASQQRRRSSGSSRNH